MNIYQKFGDYIGEFVYGGIDGAVTTFAVVAGAVGAGFSDKVIVVLGIANLIADGFSMSIGAYLSSKSEHDRYLLHRRRVLKRLAGKGASELIARAYKKRGFSDKTIKDIVADSKKDATATANAVMQDEYGMIIENRSAVKIGAMTYASFILVGLIPLAAYLIDTIFDLELEHLFLASCILTGLGFVVIGLMKSHVTESNKTKAVAETLLLGLIAAVLSFVLGSFLERLIS